MKMRHDRFGCLQMIMGSESRLSETGGSEDQVYKNNRRVIAFLRKLNLIDGAHHENAHPDPLVHTDKTPI